MNVIKFGVIGGGSIFSPELVDLIAKETANFGEVHIRFMDIDKKRQAVVGQLCERIVFQTNAPVFISYVDSYEEVIEGCDYLLIQFRVGGEDARIDDELLGKKYRIPFVETVSVCGIATFLRTYYEIEKIAAIIQEKAPHAWVLNFANPAELVAQALSACGVTKVIGVCNASTRLMGFLKEKIGFSEDDACFMSWRGLNHLTIVDSFQLNGKEILPEILLAGDNAGCLTEEGARLLDTSGELEAGIPVCPPEGDAGTGMVATNSVAQRTGNVSAGTSVFAMVVLEKALDKVHPEIDMVTTPDGSAVAMVHCNNCTSDLNAWIDLFEEFTQAFGMKVDKNELFGTLYRKALEGDPDCGGLLAYNYFSGEHITGFEEGRPLFVRNPESNFNLANFMRVHLFTALGALKTGLDILLKEENVQIDRMMGHGGLFKTKEVGQRIMAPAVNAPVTVMETAGEGGAWGIALLASYMKNKKDGESLAQFLERDVFAGQEGVTLEPDSTDVEGFNRFVERYTKGLPIEKAAVESLI